MNAQQVMYWGNFKPSILYHAWTQTENHKGSTELKAVI